MQEGWTPLHVAVQGGRVDIIKLLITRGADITIQNKAFLSLTTLLFLCTEAAFIQCDFLSTIREIGEIYNESH